MSHSQKFSVLVADAEPVIRCGVRYLLDSHARLRMCGEAETLSMARELCEKHHPAVLVLDPAMSDGFVFIRDLRRWSAGTRVVAFTTLADVTSVQRAFKAGVCGYVTRRDPAVALLGAIEGALLGERRVGPLAERALLEQLALGSMKLSGHETTLLSNRELEVYRLIGAGRSTRQIAGDLRLSVKTVETHRQRIKEKLQLGSGADLLRRATLAYGNAGLPRKTARHFRCPSENSADL